MAKTTHYRTLRYIEQKQESHDYNEYTICRLSNFKK